MNPKEQRIQREAIELGCDYADAAPKYFAAKRSDNAPLEELENFYVGCCGTMMGIMYSVVYKQKGQEEADTWLAKILMGIPSMVRSKGVPVLLTINATARPMDVHPEDDEKRKPGLIGKPPGKCTCPPVPAGLCMPCLERMKRTMRAIMEAMSSYIQSMSDMSKGLEKGCKACDLQSLDPALASVIQDGLLPGGPASGADLGNQLAIFIEQIAHTMGVKELPLTEKAWADREREAN